MIGSPFLLGDDCVVHENAHLSGWAVIGASSRIHEGARVERSVLWDHVVIGKGVTVSDSVITSFQEVTEDITGGCY